MRIPQILAQEAIATPARIGRAAVGGNGTAAVGQSVTQLSTALAHIADVDEAKRQQFGRDEAAQAAAAVEFDLKTFASDLDVTERDPDRYEQTFMQRVQETTQQTASKLTTNEGRAAFQQKIGPALTDLMVGARRRANSLYVERGTATLDETTATRLGLIGTVPFGDDEGFLRQTREAADAIRAATPYLGSVETGKRRRAFEGDALEAYANAAIADDRFDPADRRWVGMDPGRFEIIRRRAATVQDARLREQIRLEEKQAAKDAKDAERERVRQVDDLDELADNGNLTAEALRLAKEQRIAIDEDFRRLSAKVRLGAAAGGRTDDTVYNRLELDLLENPRSHSAREIRRIQATGHLAASGPRSAASLLKMVSDAEGEGKDITQQPLFKQGLQELRESLRGGVGALESLTREQATRLENAEREYHDLARSAKIPTDSLPEVARKIVDRVRRETPAMGDPEAQRLLRYRNPQDLLAAQRSGLIPNAEFNRQMELLRRLNMLPTKPEAPSAAPARR